MEGTPEILLHHLRHNKALHQQVVFLSVLPEPVPEVPDDQRMSVERLELGFVRVVARYGFMEVPDIRDVVARCCREQLDATPEDVSDDVGRPQVLPTGTADMVRWRKMLFTFRARNARSVTQFFGLPRERVVELGMQVEL